MLTKKSPDELNDLFASVCERDRQALGLEEYFARWLFADRLKARGVRAEMGFEAFEGPQHIRKFFTWLRGADLSGYFSKRMTDDLVAVSSENDLKVFSYYDLPAADEAVQNIAYYNAQDYIFQRAYPVPERNKVRVLLDFGAGHGRMANLAFNSPITEDRLQSYIAVEGISSTYFTQSFYYAALGLKVWDYFDHHEEDLSQDTIAAAMGEYDVIHLPTWRSGLIPDGVVDMVNCVQVLKELPGELVVHILPEFKRVTKASGALYIRDHKQFHNPNHMPIDMLIQTQGYILEFEPQLQDRIEIHGLPRIWRKIDTSLIQTQA